MPTPSLTSQISLRILFDKMVELAPDLREAQISALDLPEEIVIRLRMMLIFDDLIALTPERRETHLSSLDVPEEERARMRTMLVSDSTVPAVMRATASEAVDRLPDDDDDMLGQPLVGTCIGTFRLLSVIGQGGSSAVFRAEREAGDGVQFVALKLLRTGLYTAEAQRRFRREQAILAQLTHPHIASLVEGGISASGIPYIAMELVDGVPITQAANAQKATIAQRLTWFSTLCRTIEAAHASLIVHRDLKPSNLLVTGDGELKVLDFGIAKLVDTDEFATRTISIALTPEYAAPEQFGTAPLTTAVDVYALGVVLGELLTGKRLTGTVRASSAVGAGTDADASLPSGLPPRSVLVRQLRGDLDAILSNALADLPTLRYRSAGAFADDVDRYLAGQPVRAHPPSRWYRARKFVARHRRGIAATVILLSGILGSLGVAVWFGIEARRAAQQAQAHAARADSMRDFMFDAFGEAEPSTPRAGPATVVEVVDRAIASASNDRSIDPRARIELMARLAQVVGAQGNLDRSGTLLQRAREEAATVLGSTDPLSFEVARLLAVNHYERGEYATARQEFDALLAQVPATSLSLRVRLLRDSAGPAMHMRDQPPAVANVRLAVDLSRQTGDAELLRASLSDLCSILLSAGEVREAVAVCQNVLALNRARFGEESIHVSYIFSALSRAFRRLDDLDQAESYARASLSIDRKIYPGDHRTTANHLNALGITLVARRAFREAKDVFREAEHMNTATLGPTHPNTTIAMQSLAFVETQLEDYADALPRLRNALNANTLKLGAHAFQTAIDRADYGYLLALTGRRQAGIAELEQAIVDFHALTKADPDILGRTLEKRIRIALLNDDASGAQQRIDELEKAAAAVVEQAAYWKGRVDCLRGEILLARANAAQALPPLQRCGAALDSAQHPEAVLRVEQRLLQSAATAALGDVSTAKALAEQARERLRLLPYPPSRLRRLEATLPR